MTPKDYDAQIATLQAQVEGLMQHAGAMNQQLIKLQSKVLGQTAWNGLIFQLLLNSRVRREIIEDEINKLEAAKSTLGPMEDGFLEILQQMRRIFRDTSPGDKKRPYLKVINGGEDMRGVNNGRYPFS